MKKIKAILLTIWFVLSIPTSIVMCLIDNLDLGALAILNMFIPFFLIVSDKELIEMNLW